MDNKICKKCGKEFKSHFAKEFCSVKCANTHTAFNKNEIVALIKDYTTFADIPKNVIKELWKRDSYNVSKALKTHGFSQINDEYRLFKKTHKLCKNCDEFYKIDNNKGPKLCPRQQCEEFNKNVIKEMILKASSTKEAKFGDSKYNNRTKFKETCAAKTQEQINEWNENRAKSWSQKSKEQINEIVGKREATCIEKYGISNPLKDQKIRERYFDENGFHLGQSPESKAKRAKTEKIKYGGSHNSSEICKNKVAETNLKKYGAKRATQNEAIKEKVKKTTIERYGVDNVGRIPEVRQKVKNTNMRLYGTEWAAQSPLIKMRNSEKYKERYGVEFSPKSHLKNLNEYNDKEFWVKEFGTAKNNNLYINFEKVYDHFGILAHSTIYNKLKDFGIEFKKSTALKTAETKFVNELEIHLNKKLKRQHKIQTTDNKFAVDAFDPITNSIYEFLGDYWHGNLDVFEPTKINESTKTSFYELNAKTFIRLNKLQDLGYKVYYIWESDFLKSKFLNLFAL